MDFYTKQTYINVGDGHQLFCIDAGNRNASNTFVYLHGGPGAQISNQSLKFFDLKKDRVILFDQRGCGKSIPRFCLKNNTTNDLIEDIEKIRNYFSLEKIVLFGGSWGSCLALLYAQKYPNNVEAMILRGIFLGERSEWNWIYEHGASEFYPEEFVFLKELKNGSKTIIDSIYEIFNSKNIDKIKQAYIEWSKWENLLSTIDINHNFDEKDDKYNYQISLIENHYAYNNSFLKKPNQIISEINKIKHIKTYIIHGRYDLICQISKAYEIHKNMDNSQLIICQLASHSAYENPIEKELKNCVRKISK